MLTKSKPGAVVFALGIGPARIGGLGTEKQIFGISLTIRLLLDSLVVHQDTLSYPGLCSLSSFEDYKK